MTIDQVLPIVLPLLVIQVALIVWALSDLLKPERRVRGGSKLLWGGAIILLEVLGPLVYFFFGREEE